MARKARRPMVELHSATVPAAEGRPTAGPLLTCGCAAIDFRDGDAGDGSTFPPSMTSACSDRELCCALVLPEVQRGWRRRYHSVSIRAHTSPSAPTEVFFQSTNAATRRKMGRKMTAAVDNLGARPGSAVAMAAGAGCFDGHVAAQAAVVTAGWRAVAGHYHRRRDASRSGSTRGQGRCTPC